MKKTNILTLGIMIFLISMVSVSADISIFDDFNRASSNDLGNGWDETDETYDNSFIINNNRMYIQNDGEVYKNLGLSSGEKITYVEFNYHYGGYGNNKPSARMYIMDENKDPVVGWLYKYHRLRGYNGTSTTGFLNDYQPDDNVLHNITFMNFDYDVGTFDIYDDGTYKTTMSFNTSQEMTYMYGFESVGGYNNHYIDYIKIGTDGAAAPEINIVSSDSLTADDMHISGNVIGENITSTYINNTIFNNSGTNSSFYFYNNSIFPKGEYYFSINSTDIYNQTTTQNHNVTIINSPPSNPTIINNPSTVFKGDIISFSSSGSNDINPEDNITYYYSLYNSTDIFINNSLSTTYNTSSLNLGEYTLSSYTTDGIDNSSIISSTFNVTQSYITFNIEPIKYTGSIEGKLSINDTEYNFTESIITDLIADEINKTYSYQLTDMILSGRPYISESDTVIVNRDNHIFNISVEPYSKVEIENNVTNELLSNFSFVYDGFNYSTNTGYKYIPSFNENIILNFPQREYFYELNHTYNSYNDTTAQYHAKEFKISAYDRDTDETISSIYADVGAEHYETNSTFITTGDYLFENITYNILVGAYDYSEKQRFSYNINEYGNLNISLVPISTGTGTGDVTVNVYDDAEYNESLSFGDCPQTKQGQSNMWILFIILLVFGFLGIVFKLVPLVLVTGFVLLFYTLIIGSCGTFIGSICFIIGLIYIIFGLNIKPLT